MKMTHRPVTVVLGGLLSVALLQTPGNAQGRQGGQAGAPANETLSQSYRGSKARDWEFQKVAPIKVFDNLYYVGPGNVSVWLIQTTDGLVVFDSTQEPLVDHVLDSIRKVGFDPKNIRYIFLTHGHLDHFGGAGKLKQAAPAARIATLEEDWQLIETFYKNAASGRGGNNPNARDPGIPFARDLVIKEGDVITRRQDRDQGLQAAGPYSGLTLVHVHRVRQRPAAQGADLRRTGSAQRRRGRHPVPREHPPTEGQGVCGCGSAGARSQLADDLSG